MKLNRLFFLLTLCLLTSCNKEVNSLKGWYTNLEVSTRSFDRINQAIDNHEQLSRGFYATKSAFFDNNGMWSSSDNKYGTCRFLPENRAFLYNGYQIIDRSTIIFYIAWLWDPNRVPAGYEVVGRVYAGKHFGELVYCSNQMSYHTYTKVDNKLCLTNGDIFTITSSGLVKDGTSTRFRKYNPSQRF